MTKDTELTDAERAEYRLRRYQERLALNNLIAVAALIAVVFLLCFFIHLL